MKPFRNIRVIPVVMLAICGLAVLKVAGLVLDGGYIFDYRANPGKKSWAQENINFPTGRDDSDVTGSVHEKPKEAVKNEAPSRSSRSARASAAGTTGAEGWPLMRVCVSSKSRACEAAPLISAAFRGVDRFARPTSV